MPLRANMEPHDFLEIFSRKKWIFIFSVLLIIFGASIYCVLTPTLYKSTTKILVIPPRVSESLVRSTMNYSVQQRLSNIREQVLSRPRLLKVIDELDLFKEERESAPTEVLVTKLQKRIDIDVTQGSDIFTLSFAHEEPKTALLATSRLASFFIEENMKVREQESEETAAFLETQLAETKRKLEAQEEKVKGYKMQYLGELPQQMDANLSMLTRLQDQEKSYTEAIAKAEDRKVFLEAEIAKLQRQALGSKDPTESLFDTLEEKQKQLQDLSSRYTENYPTINQLRREIEQLEEKILAIQNAENPAAVKRGGVSHGGSSPVRRTIRRENEDVRRLQGQVASLNLEITALRREREENRRRMSAIESKVARFPQREQELISLTRDYNNLKSSYDDLLDKKLKAGISQNLEQQQKGERFEVLDPPNLPSLPFKPDRVKIMLLAFLGSLAFGFGAVLGLEMLDPTLRDAKEFKYFFELPILGITPIIQDVQYTRKKFLRKMVLLAGIFSFCSAVAVFLLAYQEKIRAILQISGGNG